MTNTLIAHDATRLEGVSGDSGYRRGYCHGYLRALEDRDKHPRHLLYRWAMKQLYRWRSPWNDQFEPPRYPNKCKMRDATGTQASSR